jgi:hypothetical protein
MVDWVCYLVVLLLLLRNKFTVSELKLKIYMAKLGLLGINRDSTLVVISLHVH